MRMYIRKFPLFVPGLFSAFCFAATARVCDAQAPKWELDGAAFSASSSAILVSSAAIKAEALVSVTVLFEQERYVLAADGRTARTHQVIYRIEDKTGVEEWDQASVEWDPWYQERPSIKARVIAPDGKVSELDTKTLTDVPARNESEDTFSDSRIYKGPLPGVAVGSIVEQETVVMDKSAFFAGGGIYRTYFSRGVPVVRSRLVVEAPEDVALKTKTHSLPETAVTKIEVVGKNKVYSYDLSSVPMSLNSDIGLATDKPRSVFVEFATGASWADVAAAYRKLSDSQIQPEQVKSLVASVPQGDSLATISAIVARLHKEIRYTGIEFGESALKPQTPAQVLKRHYGDCKDKAALLVGMLRASGIQAELALLSTGPGYDVGAELSGMNQFNHAIVHVPAGANGRPALWIDATAEFTKVGDLPYGDQGRMALLIADGTTGLTLIPEAKSTDSVDVETREFELKQFGPARVVETSMTTGHIDADYRYRYGAAETKSTKEDLEGYAKRFYNAKALTHMEHTDGSDLTKPFVLKLEMDKASRGTSEINGAAVGIPPAGTMSTLPRWFFNDTEADEAKLTVEQKSDLEKAKLQRAEEYEVQPFVEEVHYRVIVPEEFVARALPEDQTLQMGPAVMNRHYAEENDASGRRVVTAVMRFDTGKPRYTVDEVLALKKAAVEQNKLQYILLQFDQVGAKAIADGKVREGLAADRALIAAHPAGSSEDVAMHHVQLSAALLGVGLGDEAQKEARRATELDPKLQIAWLQLGLALEHNNIGVRFAKGFDRKGALEAYRKAKALDTENFVPVVDLAILSEYNDEGERYAAGANLADAVKEYRTLKAIDPNAAESYEDSLLFALFYDRKYAEVIAELKTLPMNATRDAMAVAAVAASGNDDTGDAAAGLKRADLVAGGDEQKSAALRLAGLELIRLERYPLAAEMLKAATAGQADSPQMAQQIAIFGSLHPASVDPLPVTDPVGPVRLVLTSMFTGTMQKEAPNFLDRNAFATEKEWQQNLKHNDASGALRTMTAKAQLPSAVMRDLVLDKAKLNAVGDDTKGYRVTMTSLGTAAQSSFVTKDDGKYRIAASGTDVAEVGNYALYLLAHGREAEARNLLDWKREQVHRGGGDDPLDGMLFPRFWTAGSSNKANAGPDAIRIAALSLTIAKPASQAPIEPALAALKGAPGSAYPVADLELLLARTYGNRADFKTAETYTDKLLAEYPDSITALRLASEVYLGTRNFKAWNAMLKSRLEAKPGDRDLLVQAAEEAEAEADYSRARGNLQEIVDAGKATANDYNSYGWLGLFDDHLDAKTVEAAQQANTLTKNANFAEMHTLACVYAAEGKTTEARQLLLAAMAVHNEEEPSAEVWFGLGLTYEQFGAKEAAIAAYRKVEKADTAVDSPVATYLLAQKHLKRLGVG